MVIWLNGCFGVGKSETAKILNRRISPSHIYDPEQVGYFLWDNFPPEMQRRGDFQDIPIWRSLNYEIIRYLYCSFDGCIIVPMTLADKRYFAEIIGKLMQDGVRLKHFILTADRAVIAERLLQRGEQRNSWAEQQMDRCLKAFETDIPGIKMETTFCCAENTASAILKLIRSGGQEPQDEC